jgi:hypothetical protein
MSESSRGVFPTKRKVQSGQRSLRIVPQAITRDGRELKTKAAATLYRLYPHSMFAERKAVVTMSERIG